ncbi:MAG: ATP synthase F1 subunit epsilon [Bdellovibrionota bacterium]
MVLKLNILSPERKLLEGEMVDEVTLTSSEGQIQILPGHVSMIGTLDAGMFAYKGGSGASGGVISNGFFEVSNDELTVMAETLELQGEIDLNRAKKDQKAAEEMLRGADLDEHQFKKYQLKLQRALIRQQFSGKDVGET